MPMRRIAGLAGLVLLMMLLAGCSMLRLQTAEPPKVAVSSLALTSLSVFEQRFEVGLRLQNPNDFPLPIAGLDYELALGGESFASGVSRQSVVVPALGEGTIMLTVTSNLLRNLEQFYRWQSDPPEALDYALTGSLRVADVPVRLPFDYSGSVPLRMPAP